MPAPLSGERQAILVQLLILWPDGQAAAPSSKSAESRLAATYNIRFHKIASLACDVTQPSGDGIEQDRATRVAPAAPFLREATAVATM